MTLHPRPAGRAGLLPAAASHAGTSSLAWWTPAELTLVERALGQALARACRRWSSGDRFDAFIDQIAAGGTRAFPAEDAPESLRDIAWLPLQSGSGRRLSWAATEAPHDVLLSALFGEGARAATPAGDPEIARELAAECWREQCAALRAEVDASGPSGDGDAAGPSASPWKRWGGAVVVELQWFGATLRLLAHVETVRTLVRAAGVRRAAPPRRLDGAPVRVLDALGGAAVRLEARCAGASIDLGSLVSLRVGDVLRLDHALDEPVRLVASGAVTDAPALCHGWLGRSGAAVGVELARGGPSTSKTR